MMTGNKACFLTVTRLAFLLSILYRNVVCHCSRSHCRTARTTLTENFYPAFEEHNAHVPYKCVLHESWDLYGVQEKSRYEDHSTKWRCELCGKAFYSSYHLDLHFDNRHTSELAKDLPVCLADYCDIFRCDILMDSHTDRFWEQALCKEDQMTTLRRRCESLVRSCLPQDNITAEQKMHIFEKIDKSICSMLTCENYWTKPQTGLAPWKIVLFAVFSPFFLISLVLYYFSVWEHYHGDDFSDSLSKDIEYDSHWRVRRGGGATLRKRYGKTHMY